MTYPVNEVLANIQNSLGAVLLTGAVIFVGYYLYYGEAIRLGFRDKTHAVPYYPTHQPLPSVTARQTGSRHEGHSSA